MKNKIIEGIKAEIEDLQAQLTELEQQEKEKGKPIVDKFGRYLSAPDEGMSYWTILNIRVALIWRNTIPDRRWLESGIVFNTKENAEKELKRMKLKQKAREFMHRDRIENDFEPDWNNDEYYCCISIFNENVANSDHAATPQFLVFSSEEVLEQFRNEFSDDDIKMILGAL